MNDSYYQIRNEIFFQKFRYMSIEDFDSTISKLLKDLYDRYILSSNNLIERDRLRGLLLESFRLIDELYEQTYQGAVKEIASTLLLFSEIESRNLGVTLATNLVDEIFNENNDKIFGYTFSQLFGASSTRLKNAIKTTLASNMAQNRSIPKYESSIFAMQERQSRANIRTAIRTYQKILREKVSNEYDKELVKTTNFLGWKSLATLDGRTTPICIFMNDKFYGKEKYASREKIPELPPRHFNCRSIIIRVYNSTYLNNVRAAVGDNGGESVNPNITFEQFLRANPNTALQLLGKDRYELWKAGRINIKRFIDVDQNRFFSIDELREILS